jgi:hypothetical protein
MMVQKHDHWTPVTDGYFVPVITAVPPSSGTINEFTAYGLLLRLTLLLEFDILPISPILLLYLIHGFDMATQPMFVHHLAPEAHDKLVMWPPPSIMNVHGQGVLDLTLGTDPMNLVFAHIPGVQVLSFQ